jgi:HEAT repeat protein
MTSRSLLVLLPILLAAAPLSSGQIAVDDRIASLQEHVKKPSDDQACVVIDGLSQTFSTMSEDDQKKTVAAFEKCLNAKREEGDDKLFETTVAAFANCGELGQKATIKSLKVPNVAKRRGVLAHALRSLGHHKDPGTVKTLTDYLVNSEPIVVAGAADALGNFGEQPEKVRKPVVEELVKNYASYHSAASNAQASNKEKGVAKDRLNVVEKPFLDALKKLTSQEFTDAPAAQKWFNDNKSKKWPDAAAADGAGGPAKS